MELLIALANERGVPVSEEQFRRHGEAADLCPGIEDGNWFRRMNALAADKGLDLEHYIISSGTFEMIKGCPIFAHFERVFSSEDRVDFVVPADFRIDKQMDIITKGVLGIIARVVSEMPRR